MPRSFQHLDDESGVFFLARPLSLFLPISFLMTFSQKFVLLGKIVGVCVPRHVF